MDWTEIKATIGRIAFVIAIIAVLLVGLVGSYYYAPDTTWTVQEYQKKQIQQTEELINEIKLLRKAVEQNGVKHDGSVK
jgi:hypothetical protein